MNCEPYLGRLPGAELTALEILRDSGLLEPIFDETRTFLGYVAVENPVSVTPPSLPTGSGTAAPRATEAALPKRKRGRPRRNAPDPPEQARIVAAWGTGNFRMYAELAQELGIEEYDVKSAVDRERKRDHSDGKK